MFTVRSRNLMLNALVIDAIQLHSGPPGDAGLEKVIPDTLVAATFSPAGNGERILAANVDYAGLAPLQRITHISFWEKYGTMVHLHDVEELSGDKAANAAGEYTVKAVSTKIGAQ